MREESRNQILLCIILSVIFLIAAVSCGGETAKENTEPGEQVIEKSTQKIDIPEVPVMFADMLYPDAEFIFEMPGLGGPMIPYRFYVANGTSIDQAADFYLRQLPWFEVETDEIEENGFRHLLLANPKTLDKLNEIEDPNDLPQIGSELDGTLVGVEVVHSSFEVGFSRLVMAKQSDRGGDIPLESTIIVLDYFKNPY